MPGKAEEIPRFMYSFEDIPRGTEGHGSEFPIGSSLDSWRDSETTRTPDIPSRCR